MAEQHCTADGAVWFVHTIDVASRSGKRCGQLFTGQYSRMRQIGRIGAPLGRDPLASRSYCVAVFTAFEDVSKRHQ
ncbi:MAG: hypothetical protein CMJ75_11595 [Planctomycetaceae bacterium]|nr:hypothetical protein [Planctomycetaceae bacterium]